jgi:hypothetical protein
MDLRKLIPLGAKLLRLSPQIKQIMREAEPIAAAWKRQAPQLVPLLKAVRREAKPVADATKKQLPTLWPLLEDFAWEAFPDIARTITREATAGYSVTWLQESLNRLGYKPKLDADGKLGEATEKAVRWFQATYGTKYRDSTGKPLEADGWAGPMTSSAIFAEIENLPR